MKRRQVLSAAAALLFVATAAHAQRGQDRSGHQDQRGQVSRQDQQRQGGDDRRAAGPPQRGGDQGRRTGRASKHKPTRPARHRRAPIRGVPTKHVPSKPAQSRLAPRKCRISDEPSS